MGYLTADGGVESPTDADGYLATGDVATIDDDGFVTITDRKKEIIITSAGKNIPPARIENLMRAHPLGAQAGAPRAGGPGGGDRRPPPVRDRARGARRGDGDGVGQGPRHRGTRSRRPG